MDRTITDLLAVDVFENINLSTGRPLNTTADGFTQEPKGRPNTLLAPSRVTTESQFGFDSSDLASFGGEGVLALDASRGPSSVGLSRDQHEGVLASLAQVTGALDVGLDFIVEVLLTLDNVPCACAGESVFLTLEALVPDAFVAAVAWRSCRYCCGEQVGVDDKPRRYHDGVTLEGRVMGVKEC